MLRSFHRSLGAAVAAGVAFAALPAQIMNKRTKADTRVRVRIHSRPACAQNTFFEHFHFHIIYTSQLSRLIWTHTHTHTRVSTRAWTISKNDSKFAWNGISFWVVNIENRYVIDSIIIVLRCVCVCGSAYEHNLISICIYACASL